MELSFSLSCQCSAFAPFINHLMNVEAGRDYLAFTKLMENLSKGCFAGNGLSKKGSSTKISSIFLVHKLVWKILLIPHICAGAAFRIPAGYFNRSKPQQGIPSPLFQPSILVSFGNLCIFQKPQFGNWVSKLTTETFRRKKGKAAPAEIPKPLQNQV